jgi:transcriptional regulator with XRE-family HTH domain
MNATNARPTEEAVQEWKTRFGRILGRMRSSKLGTLSKKEFAKMLGCSERQVERTEHGDSLSPAMIDLYEKACGDRVLVFLASEHPPGCAGSLTAQKEIAAKLETVNQELHQAKVDNGRLRGILKRQDRLLQELRAAGIIA